MLKAYYKEQEFIRIGYYVQCNFPEDIDPNSKAEALDLSRIERLFLLEDLTVHPSQINWN